MKRKVLIKTLKEFKEKCGSCYCYVEGVGFYNIIFVLPCLQANENIIFYDVSNFDNRFKIYETITAKEFKRKIKFYCTYEVWSKITSISPNENVVFVPISRFKLYNT